MLTLLSAIVDYTDACFLNTHLWQPGQNHSLMCGIYHLLSLLNDVLLIDVQDQLL